MTPEAKDADFDGGRLSLPLTQQEHRERLFFRQAYHWMLLVYVGILVANALAIVVVCVFVVLGLLPVNPKWFDWRYLASWTGGTTGLAGTAPLLFKPAMDYLFGISGERPHAATNDAGQRRKGPMQKS